MYVSHKLGLLTYDPARIVYAKVCVCLYTTDSVHPLHSSLALCELLPEYYTQFSVNYVEAINHVVTSVEQTIITLYV